jgi:hypothetical protein
VELRVLSIVHNPVVDRGSERRLAEHLGWYDPDELAAQYAADVAAASHGLMRYEIVERHVVDGFPPKVDGFRYDAATYLRCWNQRSGFHEPDAADYHAILGAFGAVEKVNADEIDEVWLFGPPYAGFYESHMAGPRAFWCNSPPLDGSSRLPRPNRRFVVMGFNYEREVGCMLENLGHRAESIMARVYEGRAANLWERFTRYDQTAPGQASAGNVHFAPNSTHDYDWGNPRPVSSDCDDWLAFPRLTGERRTVTGRDWGGGDMRLHHLWWFERIPHAAGETGGVANNWWRYIADPNTV